MLQNFKIIEGHFMIESGLKIINERDLVIGPYGIDIEENELGQTVIDFPMTVAFADNMIYKGRNVKAKSRIFWWATYNTDSDEMRITYFVDSAGCSQEFVYDFSEDEKLVILTKLHNYVEF